MRLGRPKNKPPLETYLHLTPAQKKIEEDNHRFKFVCAGRRFGKTVLSEYIIRKLAEQDVVRTIWYVAPTFKTAKDLMWNKLVWGMNRKDIAKISVQDGTIVMNTGSVIGIRGSDREDNLRGRGLDFVVMEEFAFHKQGVWELIIRPPLADRMGGALFIGTPSMKKGVHYRQLHDYSKSGKDSEWSYFHYTIYDNPFIRPTEIEAIKKSTSEVAWKQEYMAEFVEEVGVVYYEFNEIKGIYMSAAEFKDAHKEYCVRGIDWGMNDNTACVWVHVLENGELVVTHEHVQNNWTIQRQGDAIKLLDRYNPFIKASVLDGTAFKTEGTSGSSVARELNKLGIKVIPSAHKEDKDLGINILKRFIYGDGDNTWLHISDKCPNLLRALKNWQYEEHEPDVLCALRYAVSFIYKTRMSKLCNDMGLVLKSAYMKEKEKKMTAAEEIRRMPLPLNLNNTRNEFTWDYENGGWE